jgi:hypothetical protein
MHNPDMQHPAPQPSRGKQVEPHREHRRRVKARADHRIVLRLDQPLLRLETVARTLERRLRVLLDLARLLVSLTFERLMRRGDARRTLADLLVRMESFRKEFVLRPCLLTPIALLLIALGGAERVAPRLKVLANDASHFWACLEPHLLCKVFGLLRLPAVHSARGQCRWAMGTLKERMQ